MTVLERIYHNAMENPNKVAMIVENRKITYCQFWLNIGKYASMIKKNKIKKNEVIVFENSQDEKFCYTLFAIHLLGCVALPIDKNMPKQYIERIKKSVEAKIVLSKEEIPQDNEEVYSVDTFPKLEETCDILLSSGSTGEEKKIEYHYDTVFHIISSFYDTYQLPKDLTVLITGPLSHAYSLMKMYLAFYYQYPLYIYNSLNIIDFMNILEKDNYHIMLCTNPTFLHYLISLFYDDLKKYIDKIDIIECATAPLNQKDVDKILSIFNKKFYNHYGGTELPSLSYLDLTKYKYENGLVGIPMENTTVEIVNEKDEVIISSRNNTGGIRCFGKNLAPCYYEGEKINYFYTGDIGFFENNLLYIIDREKNFFNVNGFKISPIEIENIALQDLNVLECICIYKEVLILKIVVKKEFKIENLKNRLTENLLPYQIPKKIEIVKSLEKTASGKIDRKSY